MAETTINSQLIHTGGVVQVVREEYLDHLTHSKYWPNPSATLSKAWSYELMTVSITPKSAANRLRVTSVVHQAASILMWMGVAIFRDSDDGATFQTVYVAGAGNWLYIPTIIGEVVAGTTSPTTFTVGVANCNNGSSTSYINGYAGVPLGGGAMKTFIEVVEIAA